MYIFLRSIFLSTHQDFIDMGMVPSDAEKIASWAEATNLFSE